MFGTVQKASMRLEEMAVNGVGTGQKQWYRGGAVAALALAICYVIIFPLYAHVGPPPSGGDAWFKYLPGKTTIWWAIVGLSVFTDFLYVPLALALYLALKGCNRNAMLLATAFVGLFVVLDLAVTWSHYTSILTLYGKYSIATDDVQRAGYLAAANYGSAMLTSSWPAASCRSFASTRRLRTASTARYQSAILSRVALAISVSGQTSTPVALPG
jgi:hypothetical protein